MYQEAKELHQKTCLGFKHSEETIERIRKKRKETGNHWKGKHHTEQGRKT